MMVVSWWWSLMVVVSWWWSSGCFMVAEELALLHRPFLSRWVKVHQDDHQRYDSLSPRATLNVDVDRLAT